MTTLQKFLAPEFVFGPGARHLCGRYLKNLDARKVLVVSDRGVASCGWTADVVKALSVAGVSSAVFLDVPPNPRIEQVERGTAMYQQEGCDALLAIGGGSPIDCAKSIGVMTSNTGSIADYEGIDRIPLPGPPLLCIPTTAGSAAEVSQFAIITNTKRRMKMAIVSRLLVPDAALIDPETTLTLNALETTTGGLDALTHAIEAFVSNVSSPITDIHALEAIRTIIGSLGTCVEHPSDLGARSSMLRASLEAGLAFSNAILGLVHAMAHALGGMFDSPHGECNAIILPEVVRFNYPAARDKYRTIAHLFGISGGEPAGTDRMDDLLADRIAGFTAGLGFHERLACCGAGAGDIPDLAMRAAGDPCALTNPRPAGIHDIEELYARCL